MENTKIVSLPHQEEKDADCFIRLCDSRQQRLRRQRRMEEDWRKRAAMSTVRNLLYALLGATVAITAMTMIF